LEDKIEKNKILFKEQKQENDQFYKLYTHGKKINRFISKPEENYKDLVEYYNKMEYTIPDMTLKNDIFFANPLLEGNSNNMVEYYQKLKGKIDYKHLIYVQKCATDTMNRIRNISGEETKKENVYDFEEDNWKGKFKEMQAQNEELKHYNTKMRKVLKGKASSIRLKKDYFNLSNNNLTEVNFNKSTDKLKSFINDNNSKSTTSNFNQANYTETTCKSIYKGSKVTAKNNFEPDKSENSHSELNCEKFYRKTPSVRKNNFNTKLNSNKQLQNNIITPDLNNYLNLKHEKQNKPKHVNNVLKSNFSKTIIDDKDLEKTEIKPIYARIPSQASTKLLMQSRLSTPNQSQIQFEERDLNKINSVNKMFI